MRKLAASAAAAAMLLSPIAAQASSAQALSVTNAVPARAGASLDNESNLEGLGTGAYIIGAIVIGLAIWGIIELTKDDDPSSP